MPARICTTCETPDGGATWQTAEGASVTTPLVEVQNPALVHDYQREGLLVYLKEVQFDADGHPVIMYLTSRGYAPGPANDPRTWRLARGTATPGKSATSRRRTTTTISARCISTIRPRGN